MASAQLGDRQHRRVPARYVVVVALVVGAAWLWWLYPLVAVEGVPEPGRGFSYRCVHGAPLGTSSDGPLLLVGLIATLAAGVLAVVRNGLSLPAIAGFAVLASALALATFLAAGVGDRPRCHRISGLHIGVSPRPSASAILSESAPRARRVTGRGISSEQL